MKTDTKNRIIEALKEMFIVNQLPFSDITIAGVCRKAKITRKTFYSYFSSIAEASKYLVNDQINKLTIKCDDILSTSASFTEKMNELQNLLYISYRHEFTSELLRRLNIEAPEIIGEHNKKMGIIFDKIKRLIDEGKEFGLVKENVTSEIAVAVLYTTSISLHNHTFSDEDKYTTEYIMNQAFEIILNGILE